MRYTGVLLLLTALCFVSCTGKKDFKDGIVQLQSRPVSLSLDKMRCMWNGKDTVVSEERYDTDFKLVVYSDTAACSSCGLKTMYLWDDLIHDFGILWKECVALFYLYAVAKRFGRVLFHHENDGSVASCACGYGRNLHPRESPYSERSRIPYLPVGQRQPSRVGGKSIKK